MYAIRSYYEITASAETTFRIGKQKEQDIAAALEKQKQRVLRLNRQRDELSILKRDVESAQRAFEGVSQRSAQARLESVITSYSIHYTKLYESIDTNGSLSVCAYSGCWEGKGDAMESGHHLLVSGTKLQWTGTNPGTADFIVAVSYNFV